MSAPEPERAAELMSAYLDAQLAEADSAELAEYLEQSPQAQAELADLRRMMTLIGKLPRVEAPPDFADKVVRRLKRHRLLRDDRLASALFSLPFQVLSILVILAIAALYMMAQLEREPAGRLQRGPVPVEDGSPDDPGGPRPPP